MFLHVTNFAIILDPKDIYGPYFPGETFRVQKKGKILILENMWRRIYIYPLTRYYEKR
jgi:hypothetical protein